MMKAACNSEPGWAIIKKEWGEMDHTMEISSLCRTEKPDKSISVHKTQTREVNKGGTNMHSCSGNSLYLTLHPLINQTGKTINC